MFINLLSEIPMTHSFLRLGALCLFIWGVLSGALYNTDEASSKFFEREMENEGRAREQPRERDAG